MLGTEGNIRIMNRIKPTGLIGMPTFLYHLLRQAVDEKVKIGSLTTLVLGGEKVPLGTRLKLFNIALVPALVMVSALVYGVRRRKRQDQRQPGEAVKS